jgi:phage-related protein
MSDIVKGVGNLISSIVEIIKGIFGTFFNVIRGIFVTVFNVFEGALNAVIGLVKNTFNLAEGAVGFIIGMSDLPRICIEHLSDLRQETSSFSALWSPSTSGIKCINNARASGRLQSRKS